MRISPSPSHAGVGPPPHRHRRPPLSPFLPLLIPHLLSLSLLLVLLTPTFARETPLPSRAFTPLSDTALRDIVALDPPEWSSVTDGHLGKLLIPRASGSENNTLVQQYISSVFKGLGWHEEQTPFTDDTPIGKIDFNNLIYTFDADAPRKLVLAAHFDSKWFPDFPGNTFIGATDSAAPCAMLLSLAEAMTPLLRARQERVRSGQAILRDGFDEEEAAETTIQLVFFDGEEAFHDWSATDSIYGARHLASLWEQTFLSPSHPLSKRRYGPTPNALDTIDVLVLLDLLGHRASRIISNYRETDWLHGEMGSADKRLREAGLIEVERGQEGWFPTNIRGNAHMIGDDHVPFFDRGVSVLHLIANPFPPVWHSLGDNASALSLPALKRWCRILRVFVAEYLDLAPEDMKRRDDAAPRRDERDELVRTDED